MKFEYEIKFSDRRTVGITVTSANKIILRCPANMSAARAEKFLEEKSAWIEKHLQKNSVNSEKNAALTGYKTVLINGAEVPLTIGSKKTEIKPDGVFVRSLKNIQKAYTDFFSENFINRVLDISQSAGFRLNTVKLKNFKARWGSCDAYNNLLFNYKLFMLPENIQFYIIIHELCHTAQHNHSEKFWRLVERFVPDYKAVRRELKSYNFLTTLY